MSQPDAHAQDTRRQQVRAHLKQAVTRLLDGTGLQVRELAHGLAIINPDDPERGHIHVVIADGYVCWERVTWEYWGTLEGYDPRPCTSTHHTEEDSGEPVVTRQQILAGLGSPAPDLSIA